MKYKPNFNRKPYQRPMITIVPLAEHFRLMGTSFVGDPGNTDSGTLDPGEDILESNSVLFDDADEFFNDVIDGNSF